MRPCVWGSDGVESLPRSGVRVQMPTTQAQPVGVGDSVVGYRD